MTGAGHGVVELSDGWIVVRVCYAKRSVYRCYEPIGDVGPWAGTHTAFTMHTPRGAASSRWYGQVGRKNPPETFAGLDAEARAAAVAAYYTRQYQTAYEAIRAAYPETHGPALADAGELAFDLEGEPTMTVDAPAAAGAGQGDETPFPPVVDPGDGVADLEDSSSANATD